MATRLLQNAPSFVVTLVGAVNTGELKSKIDRVWDAFWSGGISNVSDLQRFGTRAATTEEYEPNLRPIRGVPGAGDRPTMQR